MRPGESSLPDVGGRVGLCRVEAYNTTGNKAARIYDAAFYFIPCNTEELCVESM